jgi:coproporphyrinogen III oxidase
VKKDFDFLETAQEDAKQIGKMKSVSKRKIIEIPSAPNVNVRLFNRRTFSRNRNWNPTIDWSNAKQLTTPRTKAINDTSKHHKRIKSIRLLGKFWQIMKLTVKKVTIQISGFWKNTATLFSTSSVNRKK